MKNRTLFTQLSEIHKSPRGKIIALTGARQTGKSTLLKQTFKEYTYINLDDPDLRIQFKRITPAELIRFYPYTIWDEIQKAPFLIEKIKAASDASPETRYILSGSSQILLINNIRESLAGRVALFELYPLTIPEISTESTTISSAPEESLLVTLLHGLIEGKTLGNLASEINPVTVTNPQTALYRQAWDHYLYHGGMPVLTHKEYDENARKEWLRDYVVTFLQKDLSDVSKLDNLEPFIEAQKIFAARTGKALNFSDIGRIISVSPNTMKKYLHYLELSFQVIKIPSWHKNVEKRMSKMPKMLFLDPGVQRAVLRKCGDVSGYEFENAVCVEFIKQCKNSRLSGDFYYLRTSDNREIDLLLETGTGYVGVEVKQSATIVPADARHFLGLQDILDKPLLGSIVLSNDGTVKYFNDRNTLCLPVWRTFSPID